MRLAVVSPFVDRRHGTERALAEVLERLAGKYGCEIHLFAQQVEGLAFSTPGSDKSGAAGAIIWHKVPRLPGPHLLRFLAWFYLNRIWRFAFSTFRGGSFDMVFSPGINCFDADVVMVHALFHRLQELAGQEDELGRPVLYRRLHRRVYYSLLTWLERRIYTRSKVALAAVSQRTAALLNQYFHRQDLRVIPNGVDTAQFSPVRRLALRAEARSRRQFLKSDFVLLLIGNDWRNKGLFAILTAMAASRDLPLRLLVVGQDAMAPSFFEAARSLGLSEQCRWETASVDAINLYAAADAYVSPTLEDAFALPPLEAMACGLPVITSAFAGVSSLLHGGVDSFVLPEPTDAHALAHLIQRLYQEPGLRDAIGEAAAKIAAQMSWDRNAAAVWELLKEASTRKSSSQRRP